MNKFALIGAALAVLMYIPLTIQVWNKTLIQNFATYALWGALDAIAAGSTYMKDPVHGNYLLPAVYVVLCTCVLVGILRTRTFKWTWVESMTLIMVGICVYEWKVEGDREAIIASTLATAIAGLPQLYDFWKKPHEAPILIYAGFVLANGVSILGGTDWSVEQRFYSTTCTILTIGFVLTAARRWLPSVMATIHRWFPWLPPVMAIARIWLP